MLLMIWRKVKKLILGALIVYSMPIAIRKNEYFVYSFSQTGRIIPKTSYTMVRSGDILFFGQKIYGGEVLNRT
jgi:hypothetical protein